MKKQGFRSIVNGLANGEGKLFVYNGVELYVYTSCGSGDSELIVGIPGSGCRHRYVSDFRVENIARCIRNSLGVHSRLPGLFKAPKKRRFLVAKGLML